MPVVRHLGLTVVLCALLIGAALPGDLAAQDAPGCATALGRWAPSACQALGADWRAIMAGGAPESALKEAVAPCARRADARQAYICARTALWRSARAQARAKDPQSLTGRYIARGRDYYGELTVLDRRPGARLSIRTERTAPVRTCRIEIASAWRAGGELAWKGPLAPEAPASTCDIAARFTGDAIVIESAAWCAWACGAGADYRYAYRLDR